MMLELHQWINVIHIQIEIDTVNNWLLHKFACYERIQLVTEIRLNYYSLDLEASWSDNINNGINHIDKYIQ